MAEKKHIPFLVLQIMQKYSDEDHPLSTSEILKHLENDYGFVIERRTLYSNFDILTQAGYEICTYNDNRRGYYLMNRQFEKSEILMLCNAIHASHFISEKQSEDLIGRLLENLSVFQQKEFKDSVYLPNRQKTPSKTLFLNIGLISEAIRDRHVIRFTYLTYSRNKRLVPRREKPYTVEPRYIVYSDSRPYLICTSLSHPGFAHYRIDRIRDISVTEDQVRKLAQERREAYDYASNKLFMYAGETEWVSFRCQNRIMDQMIDIFGPQLRIPDGDDEYFIARVNTTPEGAVFLAQQFLDAVEIIEPQELRETMKQRLAEKIIRYEGES